jgi:hypothetical protein
MGLCRHRIGHLTTIPSKTKRRLVSIAKHCLVVADRQIYPPLESLGMWPQQHHAQRNKPPAAALNPAHEVVGHSLKFDDDICLTVPDLRDSGGRPLTPMHNSRMRRRNVKDFVEKVSSLPPAPFSADIVFEDAVAVSMSSVGDDESLSSIFQDSTSKLLKPSCSKNRSSRLEHASFRGVADEMFALQYNVQRFEVGSLSSSLHGSTTSLELDDIDAKRSSASGATPYKP